MQPIPAANLVPPISFAEACSLLQAQCRAILSAHINDPQRCELSAALGRILATPIVADRDQPPFPRATRDGFAVRAEDLTSYRPLRIIGELRAGQSWADRPPVQTGEAVEIMTGAPVPPGADAVLMVEHAEEVSAGNVAGPRAILPQDGRKLTAGENVVPRGSEARHGEVVLEAGTRLGPQHIALAAACGHSDVEVYAPLQVAILATGDELVEQSMQAAKIPIEPHQIYDSNSHSLAALVQQTHAIPLRQRPARDQREDLAACIQQALTAAPLLLLTGGVSMGRYDLVEEVLATMGARFFFTGVKMQPGKPVVFGRVPAENGLPARYFFGLPGNPVSTMVTFRVFVQPLLAALSGERNWQPQIALAQLATDVHGKPGLTRFLPAHLDTTTDTPTVTPVKTQGSGDLAANARANSHVIVPEGAATLAAQQSVRVLLC